MLQSGRDVCGSFPDDRGTYSELLTDQGRCLMLFPGGAREMFRTSADKYKLMWNDKLVSFMLPLRCLLD